MKNIWQNLPKPFFALAPMDDVTDTVFRQMIKKIASPDLFFSEFTNVDGLNSPGKNALMPRLKFTKSEHPIIAQIWGMNPQNYFKAAKLINKLGFDGIDINMGCPDNGIVKKGACSGLINNPKLAKEIILATKKGAGNLPVSVKTRLGTNRIQTEQWIPFLLSFNLDGLTIHGRTAAQMSKVPARWDEIGKAVRLKNKMNIKTKIVGNGDVKDRNEGLKKAREYGVDGVMIGRGIFHNIYAFEKADGEKSHTIDQNLKFLLNHARLHDKTWGAKKHFLKLRKFFKAYVIGFEGANNLRIKLMNSESLKDVEKVLSR